MRKPHLPKTIKTNDPTVYYYSIKQKKWSLLLIIFRHWRKIKKLTFWEILSFRETKSRTHEVLSNLAGCLEIKKIETLLHRYLQHRQQRIFDGWKKKLTFVFLLTKILYQTNNKLLLFILCEEIQKCFFFLSFFIGFTGSLKSHPLFALCHVIKSFCN
jgi:hypothetical protein